MENFIINKGILYRAIESGKKSCIWNFLFRSWIGSSNLKNVFISKTSYFAETNGNFVFCKLPENEINCSYAISDFKSDFQFSFNFENPAHICPYLHRCIITGLWRMPINFFRRKIKIQWSQNIDTLLARIKFLEEGTYDFVWTAFSNQESNRFTNSIHHLWIGRN